MLASQCERGPWSVTGTTTTERPAIRTAATLRSLRDPSGSVLGRLVMSTRSFRAQPQFHRRKSHRLSQHNPVTPRSG